MNGFFSPASLCFVEESLSFTRCERPNGTFYGTSGSCRKGTEVSAREKRPFREAVVQGRFNLSHSGHAIFIKKVLEKADHVNVIVSTLEGERPGGKDGKSGNLNWNFRVEMLKSALLSEGVDTSRVTFRKGSSPDEIIQEMTKKYPREEVGVFLGKDPVNGEFANRLANKYGIRGGLIPLGSEKGADVSSTAIRKAIDSNDYQTLRELLGNNPYMENLAKYGRRKELM
jgi:FAD synthase